MRSIVGIPAAAPRPWVPDEATPGLQEKINAYYEQRRGGNLDFLLMGKVPLAEKVTFIGGIVQFYMPTPDASKYHNKTVYFIDKTGIETFKNSSSDQHLRDFKELCLFFGIEVSDTGNTTRPLQFKFINPIESRRDFENSDKNLYKIISRMLRSVFTVQGESAALCFSNFLCESFPEDGIKNKDLAIARKFWLIEEFSRPAQPPQAEGLLAKLQSVKVFSRFTTKRVAFPQTTPGNVHSIKHDDDWLVVTATDAVGQTDVPNSDS